MLRLAITGCHGRMGQALVQAAAANPRVKITAGTVSPHHAFVNTDVGIIGGISPLQVKAVDDLSKVMGEFDTLIDFTSVPATLSHLKLCQQYGKKMVIGTTGFNAEQKSDIEQMSREMAIVFSPNMSVGVNLCFELLKQATAMMGDNVDIEIIEAHHRHKTDAPSGTALKMGEIVSQTLGRNLEKTALYGRQGIAAPRERQTIGFSSIRGGDIVGDHTVMFIGEGERIEITHRTTNRSTFAHGAIRAAEWLERKREGLYTMADVLLNETNFEMPSASR